jgi:hypothetical protein
MFGFEKTQTNKIKIKANNHVPVVKADESHPKGRRFKPDK